MTAATRTGPLAGIRVIEVGHMLAGPYGTLLLADLGAEVIKIEPPEGDISRRVGPHFIGRHNAYFASLNRNKKSVTLALDTPEGQRGLRELAAESHALLTNMRPSTIKKFGLTYEALKDGNPRLVCVALTGYGLEGAYADAPALDYSVQAEVGIMMLTGDPDGPPARAGYSAVDNSSGIVAALGLLAKIVEGKGGQVDVAMFDVMLSQLNYVAGAYLNFGEIPRRFKNGAHAYYVPAQIFPTKDGHLVLFATHDRFWRGLAEGIGRPEWIDDPRFATIDARRVNRDAVIDTVAEALMADTAANWVRRFSANRLVVSSVHTLAEALDGDIARTRGLVVTVKTPDGDFRAIGSPIRLPGYPDRLEAPPLQDGTKPAPASAGKQQAERTGKVSA